MATTAGRLLSLFSVIFRISRYERRKRVKLGWSPVRVFNVASFLDRTDQLDWVSRLPASMIQSETAIGGTPVAYGFEWGEPWKLIPVVCPLVVGVVFAYQDLEGAA